MNHYIKDRYRIQDVHGIRTNLRQFMKDTKQAKRISDRLASAKFLKEIKRDLDDFLRNQGWLIKRK